MIDALQLTLEIALLWLAVAAAGALSTALAYPLFRRVNRRYTGGTRALNLLVYAALAPASASLLVILAMNPELASLLIPPHCHSGDCAPHRPQVALASPLGALLLGLMALWLGGLAAVVRDNLSRGRRQLRALQLLSRRDPRHDYRIVESPALLAWTGGWWRPSIYLSRGLVESLDAPQLAAVIAHERAHVARRDNLQTLWLRLATFAWPARARHRLWRDYAQGVEEACDRRAALSTGDRTPLIRALRTLAQQAAPPSRPWEADVAERIAALHADPACRPAIAGWLLAACLLCGNVILLIGTSHHALEWTNLSLVY